MTRAAAQRRPMAPRSSKASFQHWLIGAGIVAAVAAIFSQNLFNDLFGGAMHKAGGTAAKVGTVARTGVFAGAWAAVMTHSGVQGFADLVQRLRRGNKAAGKRLDVKGRKK